MLLLLALSATLVVLLFAHDITRSAHSAADLRRSENRSFGVLANGLLGQESEFDQRLSFLLTNGQTLTRPVFAACLTQIAQQLPVLANEAVLLRRPVLAHNVNAVLSQLTEQRVDDYQVLLDTVARSLSLPWTVLNTTPLTTRVAQASLVTTSGEWAFARWSLVKEPGRVKLIANATSMGTMDLTSQLAILANAPSLSLRRGIGIAAVSVDPAPLPAPNGTLILPPVSSIHLGVSVSNAAYVNQAVSLTVIFTPTNPRRPRQIQRLVATLGPLQSFAFVPTRLATAVSEKATLTISISGAPTGANMTRIRIYHVTMSPSGNG